MSIIFICLYFGDLPDHFYYFLKSCEYNKNINWLIYTDDTRYSDNIPCNVHIKHLTFDEIKNKIQSKFNFKISLDEPYKLCDFRPAYGYLFEDEIRSFDYWGHCDLDVIFGDLETCINKLPLNKYEKIFNFGHLTIYRNNHVTNKRFMKKIYLKSFNTYLTYVDFLSNSMNFYFDETLMDTIYTQYRIPYFYSNSHLSDINPVYIDFYPHFYKIDRQIYLWEKGHLFSKNVCDGKLIDKEFAYMHFQKRYIEVHTREYISVDTFIITPDGFINNYNELNKDNILEYSRSRNPHYHLSDKLTDVDITINIKKMLVTKYES